MKLIYGTMNDETMLGTSADDFILDLAGSDIVYAGDGNDTLYNDRGDDRLYGEAGDDTFHIHPKTTKMDPERSLTFFGGEGEDTVEFLRCARRFELIEQGEDTILKFDGGAVTIVMRDIEHIVLRDATWDI